MEGKFVFIDTETTDHCGSGTLDPWGDGDIAIVQTNVDGNIEVRRWDEDAIEFIRDLDNKGYTFVFHNAEFDLRWMRKYGVKPKKVFDTMIASQVLNAGITRVDTATALGMRIDAQKVESFDENQSLLEESADYVLVKERKANRFSHSLASTTFRYIGVKITKDMGLSDWGVVLTPENINKPVEEVLSPSQLRYAKEDVQYLPRILESQMEYIKKLGLERVIELEMRVIPANVDIMSNGILVDTESWRSGIKEYEAIATELEEKLNQAFGAELGERMGLEDESLLFGAQTVEFNVSSPSQLLSFFADYLVEGKPIEKADEMTLKKVDHPLIPELLKYKENKKLSTTYGEKFLANIKKDGRIHASLVQAETATGRYSSRNPNMQNIPADMIKGKLRAKEGYMLVTMDYSSVEARILAYAANDKNYIDTVNQKDIHRANAAKMFHKPESEITSTERSSAKVLSFSIPYGASALGMFQKGLGSSLEETEKFVSDFFSAYPNVKLYLEEQVFSALNSRKTQDAYGRIRWYEIPEPNGKNEDEVRSAIKAAKRQAQNHTIQSLSASVTKMAIADIYEYFCSTGKGRMLLTVHDSIFFEIPIEDNDAMVENIHTIQKLMVEAGPKVLPGLVAPVDYDLGDKIYRVDPISGEKFSVYEKVIEDGVIIDNPQIYSEGTMKKIASGEIEV